jgi:flagellar basal-body rod protein FlgB
MNAPTVVQGNGLSQAQRPAGTGLRAPANESVKLGCCANEGKDADQGTNNEQDCLRRHLANRRDDVSNSLRREWMNEREPASVCMHPFGGGKMNKSLKNAINHLFTFFSQIGVMDLTRIGLFDLAEKRLAWTAQRQGVLAANIANINTAAFQARDVQSFESVLAGQGSIEPTRTQPGHMAGTTPTGPASLTTDPPTVRALDGNTVSLDQQLTKVADTETTQALVTTIWKKYMGMFSMALGRSS